MVSSTKGAGLQNSQLTDYGKLTRIRQNLFAIQTLELQIHAMKELFVDLQ